jgi:PAS domain S-box-containing protein
VHDPGHDGSPPTVLKTAMTDPSIDAAVARLRNEIESRIQRATDLRSALLDAARLVRAAAGWEYVDLFFTRGINSLPEFIGADHDDRPGDAAFAEHARTFHLHPSAPAMQRLTDMRTWWMDPIVPMRGMVRAEAALQSGFQAALFIPVMAHDATLALFVFLQRRPIRNDPWTDAIIGLTGVLNDAFDRRTRQIELAGLWNLIADVMIIADESGLIVDVNPAVTDALGWPAEALRGTPLQRLVHPDDVAQALEILDALRLTREPTAVPMRLLRPDGRFRTMSLRLGFEPTEGRIVAVARDLSLFQETLSENTRLARAYRLLRCTAEIVREATTRAALLDGMCQCAVTEGNFRMAWVGLVDPETHLVRPVASAGSGTEYLNDLHISTDNVAEGRGPTGRAIREGHAIIARDVDSDPQFAPWRDSAIAHSLRSAVAFPLRVGGTLIGAFTVYTGERSAFSSDEVTLLNDVAADISLALDALATREQQATKDETMLELQRRQQRMQRLESIGTLAGGIAHDLNNTLAPIIMSTGLLKMLPLEPAVAQHVAMIESSAERGAALVKQVLGFARGLEGEPVPIDINHIVTDVARLLGSTLPKQVEVRVDIASALPLVLADSTQLNEVLVDFGVNAAQAMHGTGELTLGARELILDQRSAARIPGGRAGTFVCISVADTGDGMPPEVLDRMFEPFFTTKPPGEGSGLGLSTSLGIIQNHNGFIGVQSAVGVGSTFRIYLPVVERVAAAVPAPAARTTERGSGELILVVEDEAAIVRIVREVLVRQGFRVETARDGAEGVATFAQRPNEFALVLTDMKMPVMDGTALIHALRRIREDVRIIAMSGIDSFLTDDDETAVHKVSAVLSKPFQIDTLLRTVRSALAAAPTVDPSMPPAAPARD